MLLRWTSYSTPRRRPNPYSRSLTSRQYRNSSNSIHSNSRYSKRRPTWVLTSMTVLRVYVILRSKSNSLRAPWTPRQMSQSRSRTAHHPARELSASRSNWPVSQSSPATVSSNWKKKRWKSRAIRCRSQSFPTSSRARKISPAASSPRQKSNRRLMLVGMKARSRIRRHYKKLASKS